MHLHLQHRGNENTPLVPPLTFEAGRVNAIGGHRSTYEKGYPKLVIVEKKQREINGCSDWSPACVSKGYVDIPLCLLILFCSLQFQFYPEKEAPTK